MLLVSRGCAQRLLGAVRQTLQHSPNSSISSSAWPSGAQPVRSPLQRQAVRPMAAAADSPQPNLQVKIALCQLGVSSDKAANLRLAGQAIKVKLCSGQSVQALAFLTRLVNFDSIQEAAGKGAELVVLPEMFNCPYSNESFPVSCCSRQRPEAAVDVPCPILLSAGCCWIY